MPAPPRDGVPTPGGLVYRLAREMSSGRHTLLRRMFRQINRPTPYFCWDPDPACLPMPVLREAAQCVPGPPWQCGELVDRITRGAPGALGNLVVMRRLADGDLVFDRFGATLVSTTGYDWNGRRLSEMASRNLAAVFYQAGYDAAMARGQCLYTENIAISGFRMKTWCRLVFPVTGVAPATAGFVTVDAAAYALPSWTQVRPVARAGADPEPGRLAARYKRLLAEGYPRLIEQMCDTYDELLSAPLVNLAVTTADGQAFRSVNPGFAALLRIDERAATVTNPGSLFPDDIGWADKAAIVTAGGTVPDFETEARATDGRSLHVHVRLRPVRHMQVPGIGMSLLDLTAKRQSEQLLIESHRMEAVGQLTGGVAHDFNNFLAVIMLNLDALGDVISDNPVAADMIRDALVAANAGRELIQQLLIFSRRQPLLPELVQPAALVGDSLGLLRRILGPHSEVRFDAGANIWPLAIDPAQLQSALTNLAANARDAMGSGGLFQIALLNRCAGDPDDQPREAGPMGDRVVLQVSDSGCGMPPAILAQAFQPFFTTKERGRGSGLGLSMVHGFIRQSGGQIVIDSVPGQGTTLRLLLPRADPVVAGQQPAAVGTSPRTTGNEHILVVDDNPALLRAASRYLVDLGYRVFTAADASAALTVLRQEARIDLLLTDVVMPGEINGIELARRVAATRPDTRILLTSGFHEAWYADAPRERPAHRLLRKPYRDAELGQAVHDALAGGAPLVPDDAPQPARG